MIQIKATYTDGLQRATAFRHVGSVISSVLHRHKMACQLRPGDHVFTESPETPSIGKIRVVKKIENVFDY